MKDKILIVTESEIVAEGVSHLLSGSFQIKYIPLSNNIDTLLESATKYGISIIIIDTAILSRLQHKNFRTRLNNSYTKAVGEQPPHYSLVALVRSYTSRELLKNFDFTIEIEYSRKHIESILLQATLSVKGSEEKIATNSYELSARECEVLTALANGLQNKEIADALNISTHTVISHRKNIVAKTGIKSVAGLTVYALMNNLLSESDIQKSTTT